MTARLRRALAALKTPRWEPWIDAFAGLLYPNWCQICRQEPATARDGYVGAQCQTQVRWIRGTCCSRCGLPLTGPDVAPFECVNCRDADLKFHEARAAALATGPVREAIHRYKYQRALWFEPFLAGLLIAAARADLAGGRWDALAPAPLHPLRQRERGFNQAERLARRLGAECRVPVWMDRVVRERATGTQTRLTRNARHANMARAFAVQGGTMTGARVVIIDDVFTTGATASGVARALRRAGAARVAVWTVARAPLNPAPL